MDLLPVVYFDHHAACYVLAFTRPDGHRVTVRLESSTVEPACYEAAGLLGIDVNEIVIATDQHDLFRSLHSVAPGWQSEHTPGMRMTPPRQIGSTAHDHCRE
jgi:hypothetical protein